MKALRQPQVIEGVQAIGAAHGSKARRGQAAGENLCGGFAYPLQAGLPGAIVKGQHKQDAAPVTCCAWGGLGKAVCVEKNAEC